MPVTIHCMKLYKKGSKTHFSDAKGISNQVLGFVGWVGGGLDSSG